VWHVPIYNSYAGQDIVGRLLASGTAFAQFVSCLPELKPFSEAAASYGPVGVCYLLLDDQLVIKQAALSPGGIDWTVSQVLCFSVLVQHFEGFL